MNLVKQSNCLSQMYNFKHLLKIFKNVNKSLKTGKIFKNLLYSLLIINCQFSILNSIAQTGGAAFNITGAAADNSAILDISSSNQGILIPRISTNERTSIIGTNGNAGNAPAEGLMIFNTTTKCFEAYVNGAWSIISCPVPCIPPDAPVAAAATNISCSSFQANMVMSVAGVTSYCFDVATDDGFTTFIAGYNNRIVNNNTTCVVTGL
ncbi:MAG: hypothetical protein HGB12_02145, partial [Bacteroidetes bacterium]|nr:hypothetical protein [Bacteroidota bacterium]